MTLPLALRNRLAELILDALHDAGARRTLEALAGGGPVAEWIGSAEPRQAAACAERLRRASVAVATRPAVQGERDLCEALAAAAALFDAGLYFEVHELLEPYWLAARGADRDALQGMIQIAVGYEHLANGNAGGARALLAEGSARIAGRRLNGLDLELFARAVRGTIPRVADGERFDWTRVPRCPRADGA